MKPTLLSLCVLLSLGSLPGLRAADDTPVPPELQALAEKWVAAFKAGDDAAMSTCWHTPGSLAKLKEAEEAKEAAGEGKTVDLAKENERELKRQEKNMAVNHERAAMLMQLIAQHFGDIAQVKLSHLEVDPDNDAPAEQPAFDDVELHLTSADGTRLVLEIDDAQRLDGAWKFKGRLDDSLTIRLPEKE